MGADEAAMSGDAIVVASDAEGILVPEARAIEMIEACATQIQLATTIPDVKRVISQAEAIDAVMKKINATEHVKRAALLLLVEAEQQLGRITKQIPHAKRGGYAVKHPGQQGKRAALREYGINHFRAATAEKLADTPPKAIEGAVATADRKTVVGVATALGLRSAWTKPNPRGPSYSAPDKLARDLAFLADEAIALAESCARSKTPPHAGTVAEMRARLTRLSGR